MRVHRIYGKSTTMEIIPLINWVFNVIDEAHCCEGRDDNFVCNLLINGPCFKMLTAGSFMCFAKKKIFN